MNSPKISIIVPVYNAEKYLHRCIDSILTQTFGDFELLLIDDGSTDKSGRICDDYVSKDHRIRIFHKQNGGVASARELGIIQAVGKYSIHVDADDWIESNMLEEMYKKIYSEDFDILIADFYQEENGKRLYIKQTTDLTSSTDILKDILQNRLFGSLWHKMIRHNLYKKYDVHFIKGIDYCEDVLVLVQLLQHPLNIGFIGKAFYHYDFSNLNSITRNYTLNTYYMRKGFVMKLIQLLPDTYTQIISDVALQVKKEAFLNKVLTKKEFRSFIPASLLKIIYSDVLGRRIKLCLIFAKLGMFRFSMCLSSFINAK